MPFHAQIALKQQIVNIFQKGCVSSTFIKSTI